MSYASPGVYVQEMPSVMRPIAGVGTSTAAFFSVVPDTVQLVASAGGTATKLVDFPCAPAKIPVLVTSWGGFTAAFGDLIGDPAKAASTATGAALNANQRALAHAVYGFFNNGGTRAYVVRAATAADMPAAIQALEAIDEVALVLAPGQTDAATRAAIVAHCQKVGDRFAILDAPDGTTNPAQLQLAQASSMAAVYMPWLRVFDPATALATPAAPAASVAPSGHIAGIYARVDSTRGVHKAPANEPIRGALDVTLQLARADQDGLNPTGINCIRKLNGSILVWGARTAGGDANGDLKYVSVRRTLLFLEKSILQGTQWVVFEPNTQSLWQKINRNVSSFLTQVWRSGALFGASPQEAFYVKCDADTNPQSQIALGQVVTEIGVAIARPAEFVVFRVSQWTGPGA
jgi:phage tail sheath protein FI